MGQSRHEKKVRFLLKTHARFERTSGRGHAIYRLPSGGKFTISTGGSGSSWQRNLADLNRMLNPSIISAAGRKGNTNGAHQ